MTTAPTNRVFAPTRQFPPRPLLGITVPGWPIIGLFVVISAGLTAGAFAWPGPIGGWIVAGICLLLTGWCVWFFRDPERKPPAEAGVVISPADGVVCQVQPAVPPVDLGMPAGQYTRVAVFMNVFNVHVNRSPVDGTVEKLAYHPGKFFNASFDKASELNERMGMSLRLADGTLIGCVQIAGLVARRIVCQVREGARMNRGDRYGLIRFGSRVDVYLPEGFTPAVKIGETMVAGETVLGRAVKSDASVGGA